MMANRCILAVVILVCVQSSLSDEPNYFKRIFGTVVRNIGGYNCKEGDTCNMEAAESFGCHLYFTTDSSDSDSCLVKTYSGKSPAVYIKPGQDFQYLEVQMFKRFCVRTLAKWKLTSDLFPDPHRWYEVNVLPNEQERQYQLFIDGREGVGKSQYTYSPLNDTHIQIMVRGSALWSFECDPQDYSSSSFSKFNLVPWIMVVVLVLLLIIILISIIVYCLKKLKKQTRNLSARGSFQDSSKSTISLISSPVMFKNRSCDVRSSTNSRIHNWSHESLTNTSSSGLQKLSCNPAGIPDHDTNKWSGAAAQKNPGHGSKKWSYILGGKPHIGFQNYSNNPAGCADAEHIYEEPEEHVYEEPEEHIYQEPDEFRPVVFMDNTTASSDHRPIVPYARANSSGSSFSTANSLYGYI